MSVSRNTLRLSVLTLLAAALLVPAALAGAGNYLVVAAEEFVGSAPLTQFVNAKAAMGFTMSVYSVPPGASNADVKSYILSLWGTPQAPDYLLIVGDTDTIPHWTGAGSRHAATDLPYACMDPGDDWYPDMFYGRFAVRTEAQLQAIVDKSLYVEAGAFADPAYVRRATFLATGDETAQAAELHDWVIGTYFNPLGYSCTKVYAALGGGTSDITAAVNAGCLFLVYFGHSGSGGWSSPGYSQSNVRSLSNAGLYGLVMGWSCNTAHFSNDECFGETWIRQANKGAAAYLSASDYVWWGTVEAWESSRRMEKYFFESVFVDHEWEVSPAWQGALWRILADPDFGPTHDHTRNIFEEFTLLGDPALLLPQGDGFTVAAAPGFQSLCAPPAYEAVYTVNVGLTGQFQEAVTLSVAGAPAGATIAFSVNNQPPPFTSELTVGNLDYVAAGEYTLVIAGTSASAQRATDVELAISNAVPHPIVLLDPPDGAVDVARMPTLSWVPVAEALGYYVQVAVDPGFAGIVYDGNVGGASLMVPVNLNSLTTYYWRVRGSNGCGDGAYSAPFSFTTIDQVDYFTQLFATGFDLDGLALTFVPDGSGQYYRACAEDITQLPTDPTGGTVVTLGDDDYERVDPSTSVYLYNAAYDHFYIGSNGYITFNSGDTDYSETLADHFDLPRITLLFDDLHPGNGGTVSWKETADRVAVTWDGVPEYSNTGANTFQAELFFDGRIRLSWAGITCGDALAGLSQGLGEPADFLMSDLSATQPCACRGDANCDGLVSWRDIDYFVAAMNDNVTAWEAMFAPGWPTCPFANTDVDEDGTVNWRDIDALVAVMNTACP